MWHASLSFKEQRPPDEYERGLQEDLEGVGDGSQQWYQDPGRGIVHLRRRLTAKEQAIAGSPRDIRNTPEMDKRFAAMARLMGVTLQTMREWEGLD